jgi:hypothetical protein
MKMRFLVVQLAVWVSACGDRSSAPTRSSDILDSYAAVLARHADEAFAATLKPDYERPLVKKPHGLAWVSERYLEACRAGDRRSCWLADTISTSEDAAGMVRGHCLAGDLMSCRAIRTPEGAEPDQRLRGWAGRMLSCEGLGCEVAVPTRCKWIDCQGPMQQECAAGFPASCWNRDFNKEDQQAHARATALAREGCRAGIFAECHWLTRNGLDRSARGFAFSQICALTAERCGLISLYVEGDDLTKARDAEERACQYGRSREQDAMCFTLIHDYREGRYREPVPGRGLALAERGCRGDVDCIRRVREEWLEPAAP